MSNSLLPLDTLAGTIKAHISAGDKAIDKAEDHYKAAGIHLKDAKGIVKRTAGLTWPAFLVSQCGLQRSRADELIAIADGRKTLAEVRERDAAKKRNSRAMARTGSPGRPGKSSEKDQENQSQPIADGRQDDVDSLKMQLAEARAEVERLTEENEVSALEIAYLRAENGRLRGDEEAGADWVAVSDSERGADEIIRTEYAIEFRQTMVFEGYDDEPEAQQAKRALSYVDFQAAGALLGHSAAKNVIKMIRERKRADKQPPDKAALAALRKRSQALGYKTIHRRGNRYHLVTTDGDHGAGGDGLDGMASTLDYMEAFEAGAVQVTTTACGVPMSACDKNGPIELDDPRAVEALARLAA
jgi:hypothetical protein